MNPGIAIKQIRLQLGMRQSELAEKCGLTQTSLSQIERGNKHPSQKTLNKICSVLDVPECLLYILAMTEEDVPESRKAIYRFVFPTMMALVKELVSYEERELAMVG